MTTITRIAPDVGWLPISFVNVYFVGRPGGAWILVDAGLPGRTNQIVEAAEARFGAAVPRDETDAHVRIADAPEQLHATRIAAGEAKWGQQSVRLAHAYRLRPRYSNRPAPASSGSAESPVALSGQRPAPAG